MPETPPSHNPGPPGHTPQSSQPELPPYSPDMDLIGYIEEGQSPA
jgi:hypothetical protein